MAGNDLANMSPDTRSILMNKEIIALDQDSLGMEAVCFRDNDDYQIWIKPLANKDKAVCLLNKSDEKKTVLVDFDLLSKARNGRWGFGSDKTVSISDFRIRDLWEHKDLTVKEPSMYVELLPHTVKVYRFIKK